MRMSRHEEVLRLIDWSPRVVLLQTTKPLRVHRYFVLVDGWQERVWEGEFDAMRGIAEVNVERPTRPKVSDKELEIMRLIAAGYEKPEIAEMLGRSPDTIKTHTQRLRERLNARTAAQLVAILKDAGVL